MRLITRNSTDIRGVEKGSTASLVLARSSNRLHSVDFIYKKRASAGDPFRRASEAEMISDILSIDWEINGIPQRELTPERLFMVEKENGFKVKPGRLPVRFSQPERRSIAGEDSTSLVLPTIGENTFKIRFKSDIEGDIDLSAVLLTEPMTAGEINSAGAQGKIITFRKKQVQVTAPELTQTTYTMRPNRALSKLRCYTDKIKGVRIFLDDSVLYELEDLSINNDTLEDAGYFPQPGMLTIGGEMFTKRLEDLLRVSRERTLRFDFDMAEAGTFEMVFEEYGDKIA
jgi:hypothetical protein